jgi:hypothetical protein
MHKGFKCLSLSTSWVYISSDVVFDENIFPFPKLQSNASPRWRSEILLLPPTLTHSSFSHGVGLATNHMTNAANDGEGVQAVQESSVQLGETLEQND